MENKEWTGFIDRTGFGPGPWDGEPDKRQWTDPATGYPCLIKRNRFGNLCGYVGVAKGHPDYEVEYGDIDAHYDVHGGLTYADKCDGDEHGICHVVQEGEDDEMWWMGFDCGHSFDETPSMKYDFTPDGYQTYRDMAYVTEQVTALAAQAKTREGTCPAS